MTLIRIIKPKRHDVTGPMIMGWHDDAVESGDLSKHTDNLWVAIDELEGIGFMTVARRANGRLDVLS